MCGIYGITEKNVNWVEEFINKCSYRGPDNNAIYYENIITLGHNLLSITDSPNQGKQPWKTPRGNILIYNGEIFNYYELLKKFKNFYPKTSCDTELLAWGLDELGIKFLDYIDSMHAFAYWKKDERKLFLSRDHAGIKPLFYHFDGNILAFGSEVKGLLNRSYQTRIIDNLAFACWSYCGLNVTENSFFKGIKKVLPGETISYDCTTKKILVIKRDIVLGGKNNKFCPEEFRNKFDDTIKNSLIGTRKIGIFLSGGLDSMMIAHHAKKYLEQNSFSNQIYPCPIDPYENENFNSDYEEATKFAQNELFNHKGVMHTPQLYAEFWYSSTKSLEEPVYNLSMPMYEHMNKVMSENGIIVTLSGDMGDEILGGYSSYLRFKNFYKSFKIKTHRDCIKFWILKRLAKPPNIKISIGFDEVIDFLIEKSFPEDLWDKDDPVSSYMRLDQQGLCPEDYFRRNDRFGMKYSMEGRFPFASKKLMTYCMNIHSKHKIGSQIDELKLMSKVAYTNLLPKSIINKAKTGWTAPINLWRLQFTDKCKDINQIAKKVTLNNKLILPEDKRWSPLLNLYTWGQEYKMSLNP